MAFEHKPGKFTLFRNKKNNDSQPDYRGEGLSFEGKPIVLAVWIKEGNGGQFLSGTIQTKQEKPKSEEKPQQKQISQPEFNDDIPF